MWNLSLQQNIIKVSNLSSQIHSNSSKSYNILLTWKTMLQHLIIYLALGLGPDFMPYIFAKFLNYDSQISNINLVQVIIGCGLFCLAIQSKQIFHGLVIDVYTSAIYELSSIHLGYIIKDKGWKKVNDLTCKSLYVMFIIRMIEN